MTFDCKRLCLWTVWACFLTGTVSAEKRLLLNDPDIVSTLQQITLELQKLKADVSTLQQETSLLKNSKLTGKLYYIGMNSQTLARVQLLDRTSPMMNNLSIYITFCMIIANNISRIYDF